MCSVESDRKKFLSKSLKTREFKAAFVLIFNSFSWYFPLYIFFVNTLGDLRLEYNTLLLIFSVHYVAIVTFALIGNFLASKINHWKLLSLWIFIGILASVLMLPLKSGGSVWTYPISFSLGLSLGLGFPSCLAFFADHTSIEHRGMLGGITYFFTCISMFLVGFLTSIILNFTATVLLFAFWRIVGLAAFLYFKSRKQGYRVKIKDISYKKILNQKAFILYLVPWTMFCFVNFLEIPFFDIPLQEHFLGINLRYLISIGEFGIGGVSALIGGFLSDVIGRKRIIISAYLMVGIGYAVLSFSYMSSISFYFYILLDGISWGIFSLMFYLVIWGDLAENHRKDKYYLLGILPFLFSSFISILVTIFLISQLFLVFGCFAFDVCS